MESAYSVGKAGLTPAMKTATGASLGFGLAMLRDQLFPAAYKRLKSLGYTDTEFMEQTAGSLHMLQWCWSGHDQSDFTFCLSRMPGELPTGAYVLSFPLELPAAVATGQGTSAYYASSTKGATQFIFDRKYWKAKPAEQRFVKYANWGRKDNFGYTEDVFLDNVRLTGDHTGAWDSTKTMHALGAWKSGENSGVGRIKIENFNGGGMEVQNGTPFYFDNVSVFNCALGALELSGCALSTIHGNLLTSDDCAAMVRSRKGENDEAGATFNIGTMKNETGVTDEARGLYKFMIPFDLEGQFAGNVGALWMKGSQVHPHALAVVKPYLSNGSFQQSQLTVGAMKADGFDALVHQVKPDGNGTQWKGLPGFAGTSLKYNSANGGMVEAFGVTLTPSPVKSTKRLGGQRWNGTAWAPAYDYAKGLPAYTLDGGAAAPTPTPTPTPVPTPTPTPTPGTPKYEVFNATFNTPSRVQAPAGSKVSRIRIEGFKPTATGFGFICDKMWVNAGDLNVSDPSLKTLQKVVAGQTYTIDFTFIAPTDVKYFIGSDNGATLPFACSKLQIW